MTARLLVLLGFLCLIAKASTAIGQSVHPSVIPGLNSAGDHTPVHPGVIPGLNSPGTGTPIHPGNIPGLNSTNNHTPIHPGVIPGLNSSGAETPIHPSIIPGLTYNPPPPWVWPEGWQDFVNEDLPDVLKAWLMAIPELLELFSRKGT